MSEYYYVLIIGSICFPLLVYLGIKLPLLPLSILWVIPCTKLWLEHWYPIFRDFDLTFIASLLLLSTTITAVVYKGANINKQEGGVIALHIGLALLMAVSLLWTTSPEYGLSKTLKFSFLSLISLISPIVLLTDEGKLRGLAMALMLLGIFIAIGMLLDPSYQIAKYGAEKYKLRQTFLGANPLNPAFALAVSAIITFNYILRSKWTLKILATICLLAMMIAIYKTGSRAMFFQAIIGSLILMTYLKHQFKKVILVVLLAAALFMPYGLSMLEGMDVSNRVFYAASNPIQSVESSNRWPLWLFVIDRWWEAPVLGHGAGSFAVDAHGVDERKFPHNIFLEVLYENGLLGLILLICFVVSAFMRFSSCQLQEGNVWFAVVISAFMAVLVHWDISDLRLLWMLLGVMFASCRLGQKRRRQPIY